MMWQTVGVKSVPWGVISSTALGRSQVYVAATSRRLGKLRHASSFAAYKRRSRGVYWAPAAAAVVLAFSTSSSNESPAECKPRDTALSKDATPRRRELYPPIEPFNSGHLKVSPIHSIYWEECGNPKGKPVLFVHGGPGGGCGADARRFFDPKAYRIVLVDQRGAGKSLPPANLEDNTTWHLVEDMEKVRKALKIDKWQIFGGSWGSTLGLAYAIKHPERVTELVLRGIFMLRPQELRWFYQEGASFLFPDAWEGYKNAIPEAERGDYIKAYNKRLLSSDPEVRAAASSAWAKWEMSTLALKPDEENIAKAGDKGWADAFARIENHYFINGGWFPSPSYLLENVDKIRHIPCVIVQGRYDVVCPVQTSWDLHKAWPEAEYHIVGDAGHTAKEPGLVDKLIRATDKFKK